MEYKCQKCKEIFPEDDMDVRQNTDWVPYGDTNVPMYSYDYFCPFCGEEDPEEYYADDEDENEDCTGDCANCFHDCEYKNEEDS